MHWLQHPGSCSTQASGRFECSGQCGRSLCTARFIADVAYIIGTRRTFCGHIRALTCSHWLLQPGSCSTQASERVELSGQFGRTLPAARVNADIADMFDVESRNLAVASRSAAQQLQSQCEGGARISVRQWRRHGRPESWRCNGCDKINDIGQLDISITISVPASWWAACIFCNVSKATNHH